MHAETPYKITANHADNPVKYLEIGANRVIHSYFGEKARIFMTNMRRGVHFRRGMSTLLRRRAHYTARCAMAGMGMTVGGSVSSSAAHFENSVISGRWRSGRSERWSFGFTRPSMAIVA